MSNALTRRYSGKGYTELAAACGNIKKWAEETSLGHAGEELKFNVSATVNQPAIGQKRLFDGTPLEAAEQARKRDKKKK